MNARLGDGRTVVLAEVSHDGSPLDLFEIDDERVEGTSLMVSARHRREDAVKRALAALGEAAEGGSNDAEISAAHDLADAVRQLLGLTAQAAAGPHGR